MDVIFDVFNFVLNSLYIIVGDWGITIVLLTVVIKTILLPLTLKQKSSLKKQSELAVKIKDIEDKYNEDIKKAEEEKIKLTKDMTKNSLGCLVTLIQIPVLFSLYRFFTNLNFNDGSNLVPWITNLSLIDNYYIVPIIAVIIQVIPNILIFKENIDKSKGNNFSTMQVILFGVISFVFFIKLPVTIGIYFVTSGIFNILEKFLYIKLQKTH